jgi:endonuclease/exonuclease/phosphatase family metal-dependent hydrolase
MAVKNVRVAIIAIAVIVLVILVAPVSGSTDRGGQSDNEVPVGRDRPVTIMTRNIYLGADLTPIYGALQSGDPAVIAAAVEFVYLQAMSSDFVGRAEAIADEISAEQPHLVGMQEATVWTNSFDPDLTVDFLDLILMFLEAKGQHYEVVVQAIGFDASFGPIGLQMSDLILARTDLPTAWLKLSNKQFGQYQAKVSFTLPDGTVMDIPRQWAAVDVKIRGKSFRFITTHLESLEPPLLPVNVRYIQAMELVAGPANTGLPVIVVGDFNSETGTPDDAAWLLIQNGFFDTWSEAYPGDPGYTCCHPHDLGDPGSILEKQIDLVFARGEFTVIEAGLVGDEPSDMTASGLWPSDHAGVVDTVLIPHHQRRGVDR